jgi:ATP-dependent Lhr-like helicase
LPARIDGYGPHLIDELTASGEVVWWRPVTTLAASGAGAMVHASPIAIVPRAALPHWQRLALQPDRSRLSARALRLLEAFDTRGALFFVELVQLTGLLRTEVEGALGELVARGLVTSDAFKGLRALLTPERRRRGFHGRARRRSHADASFDAAGRWALVQPVLDAADDDARDAAVEWIAGALLRRYGVVTRSVLARESLVPPWRDLLRVYRRLEARGEIRGGRFVDALGGEQYALSEAVEALRRVRRDTGAAQWIKVSAADPLSIQGLVGAKKIAAIASHGIVYKNGAAVAARLGYGTEWLGAPDSEDRLTANTLLDPIGTRVPKSHTATPLQPDLYLLSADRED